MKIISMYLPQFHRVKENDRWWGKGFTDWVTSRDAKPLFEGHKQPHTPLDGNFYNLLDLKTLSWQADLMNKYGVDAQCFYHYYFKDGRKILERPAEILLENKHINMQFCFCWANESWARSWSNLKDSNVWSNLSEPQKNDGEPDVLLEQAYGGRQQWEEHFEYLLPFFRDERYIKENNKPVFLIYKAGIIPCLEDMTECFNRLAKANGFEGIKIIGANCNGRMSGVDAELIHEPVKSIGILRNQKSEWTNDIYKFSYEDVWNVILNNLSENTNCIYGGFVNYDDTPRRGCEGVVVTGGSPLKFREYLSRLIAKNLVSGNEYIFINAWNEWGEGMYLEPDTEYKYGYLEGINYARENYCKYLDEYRQESSVKNTLFISTRNERNKFRLNMNVLDKWLGLLEQDIKVTDYFKNRGFENIAVYGYGILARHLMAQLKICGLSSVYVIDKQKNKLHLDCPVYAPDEIIPAPDIIVVCVPFYMEEIKKEMLAKGYDNVISIETIVEDSECGDGNNDKRNSSCL